MYRSFLLIDDDRDDAELFREALGSIDENISFLHFEDEQEAMRQLTEKRAITPDLIFLDINMPALSGWDCLRKIKKEDHLHVTPVIMYTTSSHRQEKELALDLGASGFITKPSNFKVLIRLLELVMNTPAGQLPQQLKDFKQ